LEGQIIRYADRIAYINHDIDDAIRGGIISEDSLPKECVKVLVILRKKDKQYDCRYYSQQQDRNTIKMSSEFQEAMDELREFMFDNVYIGSKAKKDEMKAQNIIKELYNYLKKRPEFLSEEAAKMLQHSDIDRVVCDYIAGMTDRYAVKNFTKYLFRNRGTEYKKLNSLCLRLNLC